MSREEPPSTRACLKPEAKGFTTYAFPHWGGERVLRSLPQGIVAVHRNIEHCRQVQRNEGTKDLDYYAILQVHLECVLFT